MLCCQPASFTLQLWQGLVCKAALAEEKSCSSLAGAKDSHPGEVHARDPENSPVGWSRVLVMPRW